MGMEKELKGRRGGKKGGWEGGGRGEMGEGGKTEREREKKQNLRELNAKDKTVESVSF